MAGTLFLAIVAASSPAHATLGGHQATVAADGARLKARMATKAPQSNIIIHEMTLDSGTVAREFTRPDGTVFAVSWQGPQRPDLKQLFGDSYFARFQADNKANVRIRMRRAMISSHSDFIVRTGGHAGAFWGFAYLPTVAPAGFSTDALQAGDQ